MAGAKLTLKNPPTAVSRIFGPEKPPEAGEDETKEINLTPEEYAALGADKTVTCSDGYTVNISGGDEAGEGAEPGSGSPPPPM